MKLETTEINNPQTAPSKWISYTPDDLKKEFTDYIMDLVKRDYNGTADAVYTLSNFFKFLEDKAKRNV